MHNQLFKLKFEIENCEILGKFVEISSFRLLFLIIFLFETVNKLFQLIPVVKFAAVLRKIYLKN